MIRISEIKIHKYIQYAVYLDSDTHNVLLSTIQFFAKEVEMNGKDYYIIYDSFMNPLERAFRFLNIYLADKSRNTRAMYMHALKILYSFEKILGCQLDSFKGLEVGMLRDFILGKSRHGESIIYDNLTERTPNTVNQYLGVYRCYLDYLGIKNNCLSSRRVESNHSNNYRHDNKSEMYKQNAKTVPKCEVPKYISLEDYAKIINLVHEKYTIREECIIRLMYETGMRIGAVLGLTNEDIITVKEGESFYNCVFIRNRTSDKKYQSAKNLMHPENKASYTTKAYQTYGIGYQTVYISDELYELLGQYIDDSHEEAQFRYKVRYVKSSVADSVVGNDENFYVFLNRYGSRLSHVSWNKIIRTIFEDVGIQVDKKIRDNNLSHRFRHGFAMYQIQKMNCKAVELAKLMHHRSIASVMMYYRPTISDRIRLKESFIEDLYSSIPELMED